MTYVTINELQLLPGDILLANFDSPSRKKIREFNNNSEYSHLSIHTGSGSFIEAADKGVDLFNAAQVYFDRDSIKIIRLKDIKNDERESIGKHALKFFSRLYDRKLLRLYLTTSNADELLDHLPEITENQHGMMICTMIPALANYDALGISITDQSSVILTTISDFEKSELFEDVTNEVLVLYNHDNASNARTLYPNKENNSLTTQQNHIHHAATDFVKSLYNNHGLKEPKDFMEAINSLHTIEDEGVREEIDSLMDSKLSGLGYYNLATTFFLNTEHIVHWDWDEIKSFYNFSIDEIKDFFNIKMDQIEEKIGDFENLRSTYLEIYCKYELKTIKSMINVYTIMIGALTKMIEEED